MQINVRTLMICFVFTPLFQKAFAKTDKTIENRIVLDCFCGSGTTLASAQRNGRMWIGIDQSDLAINATKIKLDAIQEDLFVQKTKYEYYNLEKYIPQKTL